MFEDSEEKIAHFKYFWTKSNDICRKAKKKIQNEWVITQKNCRDLASIYDLCQFKKKFEK